MNKLFFIVCLFSGQLLLAQVGFGDKQKSPRIVYGLQKINDVEKKWQLQTGNHKIRFNYKTGAKESFTISTNSNETLIEGNDDSGILYGCLEFAAQINKLRGYPKKNGHQRCS